MNNNEHDQLSQQDKKLLNILEIKMYDISQNLEILNKRLSVNQIKDAVAQSFNIFSQLRKIFDKIGLLSIF